MSNKRVGAQLQAPNAKEPWLLRLIDRLGMGAVYIGSAAIGLLALNVIVDVIGRALFNTPLMGTIEYTTYWWMPALTVLSFAYTERMQEHIKVTLLLDNLPLRLRQIIEGIVGVLAALIVVALARYTLTDALHAAEIGETAQSTPPVAIWPGKLVVFAGLVVLALQIGASSYRYFAGLLPRRSDRVVDGGVVL